MDNWKRLDVVNFDTSNGYISIYDRNDRLVQGSCMSFYVEDFELMRFDLQKGVAHCHWNINSAPRLYYPRDWDIDLLVHLACSQLVEHAAVVGKIKKIQVPDREELSSVAAQSKIELLKRLL